MWLIKISSAWIRVAVIICLTKKNYLLNLMNLSGVKLNLKITLFYQYLARKKISINLMTDVDLLILFLMFSMFLGCIIICWVCDSCLRKNIIFVSLIILVPFFIKMLEWLLVCQWLQITYLHWIWVLPIFSFWV